MEYWHEKDLWYSKTKQGTINYVDLSNIQKRKKQYNWKTLSKTPLAFKYQGTEGTLYASYKPSNSKTPLVQLEYKNNTTTVQVNNLKKVKLNYIINGSKSYAFQSFNKGDIYKGCEILEVKKIKNKTYYLVYNIKEEVWGTISNQKLLTLKSNNYVPYNTIPQSKMLYHKKHTHPYLSKEDLFKYRYSSRKKVTTICPKCKNEKSIRVCDLVRDNFSCPCSSNNSSFGERLTQSYLDILGIKYIREYKFKDLGLRRFDFYLPDYNTVVEVHGIQHYKEVSGYMNHKKAKASDKEKVYYCKRNNITYIEIDARKSTFKHILPKLNKAFNKKVDRKVVINHYRENYK